MKVQSESVVLCITGGAAARAELGLADNYYDTSAGQRERMLKTTDKLDKTGDRITQGRAQLAETEVTIPPISHVFPQLLTKHSRHAHLTAA